MTVAQYVDRLSSGIATPIGAAVLGGAVALSAYAYKPGESAGLPCPWHAATGLFCPGCGTTRALHALTHGDLTTALHNNVLFVIALPVAFYIWTSLLTERLGYRRLPVPDITRTRIWTVGIAVMAFAIARNAGVDSIAPIPV